MIREREHALTITALLLVLVDLITCRRLCLKMTVTHMTVNIAQPTGVLQSPFRNHCIFDFIAAKSGEGLGPLLHHGPEMVDSVSM